MRGMCVFLMVALILGWADVGIAQQVTVEARLIRLEEGQKALIQRIDDTNQRIDDLRADMNQQFGAMDQRFGELRADMNQRFGAMDQRFGELRTDMNQRFNDLMFWLQTIVGILIVVVSGLIAQWLMMWRRLN